VEISFIFDGGCDKVKRQVFPGWQENSFKEKK